MEQNTKVTRYLTPNEVSELTVDFETNKVGGLLNGVIRHDINYYPQLNSILQGLVFHYLDTPDIEYVVFCHWQNGSSGQIIVAQLDKE